MNLPSVTLSYTHTIKAAKLMLVTMLLLFGMAAFAQWTSGCALFDGPAAATPEQVLERNYTTEIIACAATAGYPGAYDEASDMRCRAKVNCRFGIGPC